MADALLYTGTCAACRREHKVKLKHSDGIEPPALVGAYCKCTVPSRGLPLTVRGAVESKLDERERGS